MPNLFMNAITIPQKSEMTVSEEAVRLNQDTKRSSCVRLCADLLARKEQLEQDIATLDKAIHAANELKFNEARSLFNALLCNQVTNRY